MKKFLVSILLAALLLANVSAAFAAGSPPPDKGNRRSPFALAGTITAVGDSAVTVKVVSGNRLAKSVVNTEISIVVTDATRILIKNADGTTTPATLADLAVDQNVSINGKLSAGIWTATRITVGAQMVHLP